jgi:hypothetical protein
MLSNKMPECRLFFFTINPTWSTLGFNPSTNHLSDDTARDGNNALENEWLVLYMKGYSTFDEGMSAFLMV